MIGDEKKEREKTKRRKKINERKKNKRRLKTRYTSQRSPIIEGR